MLLLLSRKHRCQHLLQQAMPCALILLFVGILSSSCSRKSKSIQVSCAAGQQKDANGKCASPPPTGMPYPVVTRPPEPVIEPKIDESLQPGSSTPSPETSNSPDVTGINPVITPTPSSSVGTVSGTGSVGTGNFNGTGNGTGNFSGTGTGTPSFISSSPTPVAVATPSPLNLPAPTFAADVPTNAEQGAPHVYFLLAVNGRDLETYVAFSHDKVSEVKFKQEAKDLGVKPTVATDGSLTLTDMTVSVSLSFVFKNKICTIPNTLVSFSLQPKATAPTCTDK